jgi:hypothetical protein
VLVCALGSVAIELLIVERKIVRIAEVEVDGQIGAFGT